MKGVVRERSDVAVDSGMVLLVGVEESSEIAITNYYNTVSSKSRYLSRKLHWMKAREREAWGFLGREKSEKQGKDGPRRDTYAKGRHKFIHLNRASPDSRK